MSDRKRMLVAHNLTTGLWEDDEGGRWRPVIDPLPEKPGSVVTWQDGAYLPQIAQLDGGDRRLGWRLNKDDGGRWLTAAELESEIAGRPWTSLVPVSPGPRCHCGLCEASSDARPGASK